MHCTDPTRIPQRQRETLATRQGTLHYRRTQTYHGTQGHMGSREETEKRKIQLLQGKGKWSFIKKLPSMTKPGRGGGVYYNCLLLVL